MTPFLVLTLPRSRSFWLSKFLDCPHDPSRHFRDPADVVAYFNDGASAVDTGLGMIWDTHMHAVRRDLRVVVVHRAVPEVLDSLARVGMRSAKIDESMHRMADKLVRIPGAHFTYSQIGTFMGAGMLFTYCLGVPCTEEWWDAMKDRREEADIGAITRDAVANAQGLARVFGRAA